MQDKKKTQNKEKTEKQTQKRKSARPLSNQATERKVNPKKALPKKNLEKTTSKKIISEKTTPEPTLLERTTPEKMSPEKKALPKKTKQRKRSLRKETLRKKKIERELINLSDLREIKIEADKLLNAAPRPMRTPHEWYVEFVNEKLRHFLNWTFAIITTLALAALTGIVFFQSVTIQESSMEPTLSIGNRYFINRMVYRVSSPQRGDIVVFRTNASDDASLHVRRVIGLPKETVQIIKGTIYINGEAYRETMDFPSIVDSGVAANEVTLEEGQYFVLGDNRNNSEDSRYGEIGNIDEKYILGELWYTISPISKIGFLKG